MDEFAARRQAFRALHAQGCFAIPNPWDAGTARQLAGLGFQALATTSAGYAFTIGLPDGAVECDDMLRHIAEVVRATPLPVNADFLDAYAETPEGVAANVRRCVDTGVAGVSVEDHGPKRELFDFTLAVERIRAARAAIDATGHDVLLTARCEAFLVGHPQPLREACRRLEAFADAGADVLYAPGPLERDDVKAVLQAAGKLPVNVIATPKFRNLAELAELGVRRVSLGSGLARLLWHTFLEAAGALARDGDLQPLAQAEPGKNLNTFFRDWVQQH